MAIFHVYADEVSPLNGRLDEPLEILEAELPVQVETDVRRLHRDVGVEPVRLNPLEQLGVLPDRLLGCTGRSTVLAEKSDGYTGALAVEIGARQQCILKGLPGNVAARDAADERLRDKRQESR